MAGLNILELKYKTNGASAIIREEQRRLGAGLPTVLTHLANIEKEELEHLTPVSHSGRPGYVAGQTKKSWKVKSSGSGANATRLIYNEKRTLRFVLKGRKAIDNTEKGYPLHFWIDGREFYRWRVRAAKANNFIPIAVRRARQRGVPIVHADIQKAISVRSLVSQIP